MKFSSREDIDAPIDDVFKAVTDFDAFERRMLRRGVDVTRNEEVPLDSVGAQWQANVSWRGRTHKVDAELVSLTPGEGYAIESRSGGVECMGVVDLVALSKSRTRMFVSIDLKPTTLSSRLFVQSLRLAKGNLTRRFKARVSEFAKGLSE
ncbi:MAG: SRPBCC family protein [Paracoccaceae bacterium]|nr:SRPBCC family protein [Paracoccaceae bacterium]